MSRREVAVGVLAAEAAAVAAVARLVAGAEEGMAAVREETRSPRLR